MKGFFFQTNTMSSLGNTYILVSSTRSENKNKVDATGILLYQMPFDIEWTLFQQMEYLIVPIAPEKCIKTHVKQKKRKSFRAFKHRRQLV